MTTTLRLLVVLGAIAQALMLYLAGYELRAMLRGDLHGIFTLSDLPLVLGLLLALFLWFNPIRHHP